MHARGGLTRLVPVRSVEEMKKSRASILAPGLRRAIAPCAVIAAVAVLGGCAPSPTTTYLDPSGAEVTVDWADYPGSPGLDATDVPSAPSKEDIEQVESALIAEIEQALGTEFDLDLQPSGEARWFPAGGNGYGGESAYVVFNSQDHVSDTVPRGADDWRRVIDIVSGITDTGGLGPVELDHERADADAGYLFEQFGTDEPDDYWQWTGAAYGSSQWLSIALTDVAKDGSGEAAKEWRDGSWPAQSIAISSGATTLPRGELAGFEHRLAPFSGLDMPPTTTSD